MLAAVVLVGSLGLLGPRAAAHMDFLAERRAYAQHHKMSLDDCADAMERRGFLRRAAEERVRFVRDLGVFPDHWQGG